MIEILDFAAPITPNGETSAKANAFVSRMLSQTKSDFEFGVDKICVFIVKLY
jgi:hypothetical protein